MTLNEFSKYIKTFDNITSYHADIITIPLLNINQTIYAIFFNELGWIYLISNNIGININRRKDIKILYEYLNRYDAITAFIGALEKYRLLAI